MKKQVTYNFSRLLGEKPTNKVNLQDPLSSRNPSGDKQQHHNANTKASHRLLRPAGMVRVRKDQTSNSKSSLHSTSSRESLNPHNNPYRLSKPKNVKPFLDEAESFFEKFDQSCSIKYTTVSYRTPPLKRRLDYEFEQQEYRSQRFPRSNNLVGETFGDALKSSLNSQARHSSSRDTLVSCKSKVSLKEIETRHKQSQEKFQRIRQKVNELYRLNFQSSQKEFRSIVMRESKSKKHRLLH